MSIVERARNILTSPRAEWLKIDTEPTTVKELFTGYAMILALLPLIGSLIGFVLAVGSYRYFGISAFLLTAIPGYLIGLGILYLMGIIADSLAPSFDGTKNRIAAMKLVVYSGTPIWIAGFLAFIPGLGPLISLVGFGYGAYLLYLGSSTVMKVPEDKAIGYTAVVIIIWILLGLFIAGIIIGAIVTSLIGGVALGGGGFYG